MTRIVVGVELDAGPDDVWRVLEPIERHVEWMADAAEIRFTGDQTRGVGTTFRCRTAIGPLRVDDRMEITEWEPGRRMGVRHTGVVTGTGRFDLAAIDGGARTALTWTEELTFPWYLGGSIGAGLGGRQVLQLVWRRNLSELKRVLARGR